MSDKLFFRYTTNSEILINVTESTSFVVSTLRIVFNSVVVTIHPEDHAIDTVKLITDALNIVGAMNFRKYNESARNHLVKLISRSEVYVDLDLVAENIKSNKSSNVDADVAFFNACMSFIGAALLARIEPMFDISNIAV